MCNNPCIHTYKIDMPIVAYCRHRGNIIWTRVELYSDPACQAFLLYTIRIIRMTARSSDKWQQVYRKSEVFSPFLVENKNLNSHIVLNTSSSPLPEQAWTLEEENQLHQPKQRGPREPGLWEMRESLERDLRSVSEGLAWVKVRVDSRGKQVHQEESQAPCSRSPPLPAALAGRLK